MLRTMDVFSLKDIKNTLKEYEIRPSKRLGQNFLIREDVADKVLKAGEISSSDTILEIGPGLGSLTFKLAASAKKVIAIEKDKRMADILKKSINNPNAEIIRGDILKFDINDLGLRGYKIISNLPYCISSPVIRKFLEEKKKPELMVLMLQKEVAQRIKAKPPFMNILAVSVQIYAQVEIKEYVSKKSFWPEPKVDSAIVKIIIKDNYLKEIKDIDMFFKIVKAGFSHPRKQILNNFSKVLKLEKKDIEEWLKENNIDSKRRAQTLKIEEWLALYKTFHV